VLAIAIIAIVYTSKLSWISLFIAGIGTLALITLNLAGVKKLSIYLLIGVVIWVGVLKSGIHATLAGVIVGLCIPIQGKANKSSPLKLLEHKLH
ncbi:Na(+)/H(+) antiporter NhaA, partial [bacterium LRH843]|nr:Na(+)/H(+) antiporter NhaA [bacterium LRH843]